MNRNCGAGTRVWGPPGGVWGAKLLTMSGVRELLRPDLFLVLSVPWESQEEATRVHAGQVKSQPILPVVNKHTSPHLKA